MKLDKQLVRACYYLDLSRGERDAFGCCTDGRVAALIAEGANVDAKVEVEAGEVMVDMKCTRNGSEWLSALKLPICRIPMIRLPYFKILEFITPILIMEESVWLCSKIVNLSPVQLRL